MKKTILMCLREPAVRGFLTVGLLTLLAGSVRADEFAYVLGGGTYPFGTVDLNTGAYTPAGSLLSSAYGFVVGLGVAGGTLYTEGQGGYQLDSVNPSNGALITEGGISTAGASFFGSTTTGLYGMNDGSGDLFSINPLTGAATPIGPTGLTSGGTALSTNSSTLYYEYSGSLYTLNTTTGAATLIGSNSSAVDALLYEAGTLYAGVTLCNGGPVGCTFSIDTVNTSTGALTQGPFVVATGGVQALAPDPLSPPVSGTPEPGTVTLMLGGAAAIAGLKRVRR